MPYVEGFGTYPFGEEWLFDAVLRSYVPVLDVAERLTMTVTPVLADQLEVPGLGERLAAFGREFRLGSCLADAHEQDVPSTPHATPRRIATARGSNAWKRPATSRSSSSAAPRPTGEWR